MGAALATVVGMTIMITGVALLSIPAAIILAGLFLMLAGAAASGA